MGELLDVRAVFYFVSLAIAVGVDAFLVSKALSRGGAERTRGLVAPLVHAGAVLAVPPCLYAIAFAETRKFGVESYAIVAFNVGGIPLAIAQLGTVLALVLAMTEARDARTRS